MKSAHGFDFATRAFELWVSGGSRWASSIFFFYKQGQNTFSDFQVNPPVRIKTTGKCISESFLQVQLFILIDVHESPQLNIFVPDPDLVFCL